MSLKEPVCSKPEGVEQISNKAAEIYSKYLQTLIDASHINLKQNKELASKYYDLVDQANSLDKSIHSLRTWRWFLILFLIFPFFLMTRAANKKKEMLKTVDVDIKEYKGKLVQQLTPLYKLNSISYVFTNIVNPLLEDYELKPMMDFDDFTTWNDLPDHFEIDKSESFSGIICGKLFGNPVAFFSLFSQKWIKVPYVWVDSKTHITANGNAVEETLVAVVEWPYPVYINNDYMSYKSNFAPSLTFNNIGSVSKHSLKKQIKKGKIDAMDNEEFDKLFMCKRNSEQEFRTVFSVLTQEKYVDLIKQRPNFKLSKDGPFFTTYTPIGKPDPVRVKLRKGSSEFEPVEHYGSSFDPLFSIVDSNCSFDIEQMKADKINAIKQFMKAFCNTQLPYSNLPAMHREYYREKSTKKLYGSYINDEALTNILLPTYLNDRSFETGVIAKAISAKNGKIGKYYTRVTQLKLTYYVSNIIFVPAYASGDHGGKMVNVPVRDFKPRFEYCYLLQIKGFDKDKDNVLYEGPQALIAGTYIKIFKSKPTDAMIKSELKII